MLSIGEGTFLRDGIPHQIIGGAIHYFRVDPSLWRDRLVRLLALGLNTVAGAITCPGVADAFADLPSATPDDILR